MQIWLNKALRACDRRLIKNTEHTSKRRLDSCCIVGENPSFVGDSANESLEEYTEQSIYDMLNGSQLVGCTVKTEGLAPELARERDQKSSCRSACADF